MIEFDGLTEALRQLERLDAACDALPAIAQQVQGETTAYMRIQADLSIYNTPQSAGGYIRTGALREGLSTTVQSAGDRAEFTTEGTAPHTPFVEAGRTMNYAALQALAAQNAHAPYTLGRTGLNWTEAAPMVTAGQTYALYRVQALFTEKLRAVWGREA